ncbi:MAG: peptide-methionine (S)-S-oxide reductase MsrA [Boseongicola sp.]|nr:peptide-methionine (S)-S-oxide reductase MsrA [Boseongicola sp.]NNJ66475.1 peptide-methionine (S)-S-oxide reductase MsrA [Boseongicola sp.]
MSLALQSLKAPALAVLIMLGVAIECGSAKAAETEKAYFAGGCFWCIEADFERLPGVGDVISGFTGGTTANPTYKQVTGGNTGHYEAVEIPYDPEEISYDQLLYAFFRSVDPTDAGGQFCDRGDSYRTAIFVSNAEEMAAAESAKARAQRDLGRTIVTPILDASEFTPADDFHQNYYKRTEIVLTRRGPKTKANAYKFYRNGCRRDQKVLQLWGDDAVFAKPSS